MSLLFLLIALTVTKFSVENKVKKQNDRSTNLSPAGMDIIEF